MDTHQLTEEREHGHVTAQMTVYGASGGASINGSFDRSRAKESSTSYTNSQLLGDSIDITTSGDAVIRGANIHANTQLDANIAGNLTLESVQDRSTSKNNSFGVSGGVSLGGISSKEKNGQRLASGGKVLSEDSFAYNLHDANDVKGASGANGGFNVSNGYSDSKQTVLTSLTSGGVANVHVGGHTQLNGALLATVDEQGNDLGLLNFNTKTFGFSDLTNTSASHQMSGGFSTNINIGNKPNQPQQNNAQDDKGDTLNKGTSHIAYKNISTNDANKTLATLGRGDITIGTTQLEQDGNAIDAASTNSALTNLNRDTSNTTKELWSINRTQGNIDANIDNRFLSPAGWEDIGKDVKKLSGDIKAISHNVTGVFKDQTSVQTIKDNYRFALVNQGKMDEASANELIDNLSSKGYFENQSAIAKVVKANGNMDVEQLRGLDVNNTFSLEYNQYLQQAQFASGDVLVTAGKSHALGVVVTDSAAMLNRAINELPENKRKAGSEAFNLLTSGPTGYIISKGAERGVQYLPDTAKQALGKFGEKVDTATTGISEAGVGFLVSDENKNVGNYYEGTQENRESGQDVAQDRVDGTKMVVGGIITATGAAGIWKAASRDGGVAGGAAKDGKKTSNNGSKEKQPGLEDNEAGYSEFGGNGGKEPKGSGKISKNDEDLNKRAAEGVKNITVDIDFEGHILGAEVKSNGKVVGGHSTTTGEIKVIEGTASTPNEQGVYKAKIEVEDPNNPGSYLPKTNNGGFSTMFPDAWNADRIKVEVDTAFKNKTVEGNKWTGTTPSGVKVEGYLSPKITVYPIL